MNTRDAETIDLTDTPSAWPVSWSAVWVGALSALAALIIFGLCAAALGFHLSDSRILDWKTAKWGAIICSVLSAFFAFVIGGWAAGRVGGFRFSEPAMLHGAIAWLVAVPLLLFALGAGGSAYMDNWYSGLGGNHPAWAGTNAVDLRSPLTQDEAARAARNAALTAVTALLLGLIGSVVGGWMASGEPMTFTHHLRRSSTAGAATDMNASRGRVSV